MEENLKSTDNNKASYSERNQNINIGEEIFESYMNEFSLPFHRLGFDEKNNKIEGFQFMHPLLRSLPDYISYFENKKKLYYIQVKGTNKIKLEDLINYSTFESMFCDSNSQLVVFFCFKNEAPIVKTLKEVKKLVSGCVIKEFHDNKQYVELNLNSNISV